MIDLIISGIVGYALGNIQTSYIVTRIISNKDIRNEGSGNAGASNTVYVLGWWAGLITFIVDVGKAWIAMIISYQLFPYNADAAFFAGSMAVIGHVFPVVLHFNGGKGIASIIGLFFGTNITMGLVLLCIMGLTLLISRYVVVASLLAIIILPIFLFFQHHSSIVILTAMGISFVGIYKHLGNIENLIADKEISLDTVLKKNKLL